MVGWAGGGGKGLRVDASLGQLAGASLPLGPF